MIDGVFYKTSESKPLKRLLQHHLVDRPKYYGSRVHASLQSKEKGS